MKQITLDDMKDFFPSFTCKGAMITGEGKFFRGDHLDFLQYPKNCIGFKSGIVSKRTINYFFYTEKGKDFEPVEIKSNIESKTFTFNGGKDLNEVLKAFKKMIIEKAN